MPGQSPANADQVPAQTTQSSEERRSGPFYYHRALNRHYYHLRKARLKEGEAQQQHLQRAEEERKEAEKLRQREWPRDQEHIEAAQLVSSMTGPMQDGFPPQAGRRNKEKLLDPANQQSQAITRHRYHMETAVLKTGAAQDHHLWRAEEERKAAEQWRHRKVQMDQENKNVEGFVPANAGSMRKASKEVLASRKYAYARLKEVALRSQADRLPDHARQGHLERAERCRKEAEDWRRKAEESGDVQRIRKLSSSRLTQWQRELLSPSPLTHERHSDGPQGPPSDQGTVSEGASGASKTKRRRPETPIWEPSSEPAPAQSEQNAVLPSHSHSPQPDTAHLTAEAHHEHRQETPRLLLSPRPTEKLKGPHETETQETGAQAHQHLEQAAEDRRIRAEQRQSPPTDHESPELGGISESHDQSSRQHLNRYWPQLLGRQQSSSSSDISDLVLHLPGQMGRGPILD